MSSRQRRSDLAVASSAASVLIDSRIADSTRKRYDTSLKVMKKWWRDSFGRDLTVPVDRDRIVSFFGWLVETKYKDKPVAVSTLRGYKSALVSLYTEAHAVIHADTNLRLESLLVGYTRRVADMKLAGLMPMLEGKLHLTFEGYRSLARAFFNAQPGQMLFAWPYLVLQWNIIARAASVASLMMEHVSWEADALLLTLPKHKGDQDGSNVFARHLYANPADPVICPVLALAVVIFTRVLKYDAGGVFREEAAPPNYRVFDGANPETRFSDIFGKVVAKLPTEEQQLLGGTRAELGTHSIRKGAATYCCGMVNGPTPVQVFLRAGWMVGGVKDRYLFAGGGGDQLTGRVLSGLPYNDVSFASLPPHFDSVGAPQVGWATVFPLYSTLPGTVKRALPFLLASICYHEVWLRESLSPQHPLFSSPLFTSGTLAELRSHIRAGCYRSTATGLTATGIPPHLAMSNELTTVARETAAMKAQLLSQYAALPADLTSHLLAKFTIQGAIPVTLDDLKAVMAQAVSEMHAHVRNALPDAARAATAPAAADLSSDDARFNVWAWGGAMHMVPEGWRMSSTDLMSTWRLWHFGNAAEHIRPLRHLKKGDLADKTQHRSHSGRRRTV